MTSLSAVPHDELLEAARRHLGTAVDLDPGARFVQGAVGQVVGLHDGAGTSYVLKTYAPGAGRRAATEVLALGAVGEGTGIPVPVVLGHGELATDRSVTYVLMSRLGGVRWADRRRDMSAAQSHALHRRVGQLLRRLHVLPGDEFGDLLTDGARWPSAWARVDFRCHRLVEQHEAAGGSMGLARRVRRLVDEHREALSSCTAPVLCHNDFIDGNLLVAASGTPHVSGVVDLERASWDDPLADLAQTRLNARYHDPAAAQVLVSAYGICGDDEQIRVDVHEVLHAFAERTWITGDRPKGWERSIAALERFVLSRT